MARVMVEPYFENTTMQAYYNNNNVLVSYFIYPIAGYVLHDKAYDVPVRDEETGEETGEMTPGYTGSYLTVLSGYDFEANPDNIYAVPTDSVPADQIFGGVDNDHEVMSNDEKVEEN